MHENNENKNKKPTLRRQDIIYPELSYRINGVLFDVFKEVGPGLQEKYYQRAIAQGLQERSIQFQEQVSIPLAYKGKSIGRYFLDFLIEGKIILELKRGDYFQKHTLQQIVAYLQSTNKQLGLIANFTTNGVRVKRILNSAKDKQEGFVFSHIS